MTSTTRIIGCEGKAAFSSPALAHKAAGRRVGRQVYRCEFCGAFHVGTAPGRSLKTRDGKRARR